MLHRVHESRALQLIATSGPVLVVLAFAVVTAAALERGQANWLEIERGYRITSTSENLLRRLVDAETAQRGFTVTGDTMFLEPLADAQEAVTRDIHDLRKWVRDPDERRSLDELEPRTAAFFHMIAENVEIRRAHSVAPAERAVRAARGKAMMDDLRRRLDALQSSELAQVRDRSAAEGAWTRRVFTVLGVGAAFSALAMIVANLLFARHTAAWQRLAGELNERNALLEQQTARLEMQRADLEESADALRRSEHRFRSLIEHSSDLISVVSEEGLIRYHSPNARRVLGHDAADLIGHEVVLFVHPEDAGKLRHALERGAGEDAAATRALECRWLHADGTWRLLQITASMLPEEGAEQQFVLNARDVTDRKRAEADLQRSENLLRQAAKMEALGRLAGGVAHDFNNLLTVISGNAVLMESDVLGEGAEMLDEIRQAAARAAGLTRQLLVFSRHAPNEPRSVEVNPLLQNLLAMLRRLISEGIEVHLAMDPRVRGVRVDPGQLEQVMVNLAVNAADAMPDGGHLTIETHSVLVDGATLQPRGREGATRAVLIAVSDTGFGMDERTRSQVFEPFFTTKEQGKGTGLGLSTSYGIVQQAGGNILVYSEPGMGTTFKIYLPESDAEARADAVATGGGVNTGDETILLVEDEPAVRKLIGHVLRESGYTVIEADSAPDALAVSAAYPLPVDLLLTDVVMPGGTGTDLARTLHGSRPGMKVICMSGYTGDAISRHGITEVATAFIQKPCLPDELLQIVRSILDREGPVRA